MSASPDGAPGTTTVRTKVTSWVLRIPPAWSSVAVLVAFLWILWTQPVTSLQIDSLVYRYGAEVLFSGTDRLYEQPDGALPFTYPPVAALFFTPLLVAEPLAALIVIVAGLASVWRMTWLVLDYLRPEEHGHAMAAAALLPLAVLTEPIFKTFSYGQINLVLAWLVTEDLLGRHRGRFGGILVGLATLIKLTPAAFFLIIVLRRDVASFLRGIGTIIAGVVLGFLLMPSSSRIFWSGLTGAAQRVGDVAYFLNQSTKGAFARSGITASWPWILACLLILAATCLAAHLLLRSGRDLPAVLVTAFCALLISPVSWSHHWVWTWPLMLWAVIDHRPPLGKGLLFLGFSWAFAVLVRPFWWAIPHHGPWHEVSWWQLVISDTYMVVGAFTLVMLTVEAFRLRAQGTAIGPGQVVGTE
ncbi:glycosyltransferase 87 family protein [Austwickia chelonae]|uniref:glycosyltransferase 87 family protein n=1 Tax=Austwickia chelonae TaxID=100225 RepID=UPI000E246DB8|nr:glycosyltransferase 87 family protein [Austwickia chelonae]